MEKLTEGPWTIKDQVIYGGGPNGFICSWSGRQANAKAICKAVNNTYHKGIDPEAVPDMVEALKKIHARCKDSIGKNVLLLPFEMEIIEAEKALTKAGININEN